MTCLTHGLLHRLALLCLLCASAAAQAHDYRAGDIIIDHPYAAPTAEDATRALVYLRGLANTGETDDALVAASTELAERVVFLVRGSEGAPQGVDAVPVPAASKRALGPHSAEWIRLEGLKQPLVLGDRFDLQLRFARGGEVTVKVWVQTIRPPATAHGSH